MKKIILVLLCCSCGVKTVETDSALTRNNETISGDSSAGFDENNYESFLNLENYKPDKEPTEGELLIVDSASVIIVYPNEAQAKEMEEKYGEDFATIADDASFYQAEATTRLDSIGVRKIIVPTDKKVVQLRGTQSWMLDIRKEGAPEWNMIFFRPDKSPEIVSAIDVTTDKIKQFFTN